MSFWTIALDDQGDLQIGAECPTMLRLFLEDVGFDLACCDSVLAGLTEVRAGLRPAFHLSTNVTHLVATADGALFTIAAKLTRNTPVPITLDDLESGVRRLRAFTETLPDDQRW